MERAASDDLAAKRADDGEADGKRRFGTVDPFLEAGDWSYRQGRTVANRDFLRALLVHGNFDQYDFYCPDEQHRARLRDEVSEWLGPRAAGERARWLLQAELADRLRRVPYEVFHLSDFTFSLPHLAWMRNAHAGAPFPLTGVTHSLDGVRMASRYLELALAGLQPHDAIVCTSRAGRDAVAHASGWMRSQLGALGMPAPSEGEGPRLPIIPLGVADDAFTGPTRAEARAKFGIPAERRVLLSVGRLSARSKCDWSPFLELVARMRTTGELGGALVLLAGGASDTDVKELDRLIARLALADSVVAFPNFPPALKTSLFAAADVYLGLVDNIQETFGLSLVEAMAAGLPILAVDYSGYRDIVEDGVSGILIPTVGTPSLPPALLDNIGVLDPSLTRLVFAQGVAVDLEALRDRLRALIADGPLRAAMGAAARRRAESFRLPKIVAAYEALWRELGAEARRTPPRTPHPPLPPTALLWGDMPGTFGRFPSRTLSDDDGVTLTEIGRALSRGEDALVRLDDVRPFCDAAIEAALVAALAERDGPSTVGALVAAVGGRLGERAGAIQFQLVYLVKHGAVALARPAARSEVFR